jgi:branched-chain amino acid transport system permease protein
VQVGAIRASAPGKVESSKIRTERLVTVVVGHDRYALEAGDEESVKKGTEVTAGQVLSAKGVKAANAGLVTNIEVQRPRYTDLVIGGQTYTIPQEQSALVKSGEQVAAGQKLSSGIQILSPLLVLAFAMIGCAILGFLIERIAYRPLRNAPRINSLITAIGMSLLIVNSVQQMFGADPKGFPGIIPPMAPFKFGTVQVDPRQLTVLIVAVALMIALQYIVYYTRLGLGMRAVSYNHAWAGLMGVPVDQVITATFMIGSALAGAAGILVGVTYVMIQPYLGMLLGLKAFVAAVLGGIGNLPGALLGGLLMGLSEEMVAGYISSNFRDAIAFLILILILLLRPAGLLGKSTVEKV